MKIDNMDFNEQHFAAMTEDDFIKDQLASVQDFYGDDEGKKAFLKEAYAKIKTAVKGDEKPAAKK